MKIGLLTYFWENNYGQYWQAVATLVALRKRFPQARVELVNVRHWGHIRNNLISKRSLKRPWTIPASYRALRGYRDGRNSHFEFSLDECLTTDYGEAMRFIEAQAYDLVVVGADVVLKPLSVSRVAAGVPLYWVSPEVSAPKALLASSADITGLQDLSPEQVDLMRASLGSMAFIGVRDSMSANLCEALGSAEVPVQRVPDPTFSLDVDESWLTAAKNEIPHRRTGKKRAIVHFTNTAGVERITATLQRAGFEVLSVGAELPHVDRVITLSPEAWAGMSTQADVIVTMSFHESIYTTKHGCPVIAIDTQPNRYCLDTGMSKTSCLMHDLGLASTHHLNLMAENFEKKLEDALNAALNTDYEPVLECHASYRLDYQRALDSLASLV